MFLFVFGCVLLVVSVNACGRFACSRRLSMYIFVETIAKTALSMLQVHGFVRVIGRLFSCVSEHGFESLRSVTTVVYRVTRKSTAFTLTQLFVRAAVCRSFATESKGEVRTSLSRLERVIRVPLHTDRSMIDGSPRGFLGVSVFLTLGRD